MHLKIYTSLTFPLCAPLCFECEMPLEGNFNLKHPSSPFSPLVIGFDTHWGTLRCYFRVCKCLDSGKWFLLSSSSQRCQRLTPSLTRKYANAFITIQTSFYSPNRACVLLESGLPPQIAQTTTTPPHQDLGLLRAMTTQKCFTLGAGPAFCGSVNNGRSSNTMSFRPGSAHTSLQFSLHFLWYQQTERWNTAESTGEFLCSANVKMCLLFSTTLTQGLQSAC